MLLAVDRPSIGRGALPVVFLALASLTREDNLAGIVLVPGAGLVYAVVSRPELFAGIWDELRQPRVLWRRIVTAPALRVLVTVFVTTALFGLGLMVLRLIFVPSAAGAAALPSVAGLRQVIEWTIQAPAERLTTVWAPLVLIVRLGGFALLNWRLRLVMLFWLGALVLMALPGLIYPRTNVLMVPITCFGFALALSAGGVLRFSRPAGIAIVAGLAVMAVASVSDSQQMQLENHPENLDYLLKNEEYLWGIYADARVPASRRIALEAHFQRYGLTSHLDFVADFPKLAEEVSSARRTTPSADGSLFAKMDFRGTFSERAASPTLAGTGTTVSLEEFVAVDGKTLLERGELRVATSSTIWAFAARLPIKPQLLEAEATGGYVRLTVQVENGAVGVGLLSQNGRDFVSRQPVIAADGELEIFLKFTDLSDVDSIVIQTWDRPIAAQVIVSGVTVFFADAGE